MSGKFCVFRPMVGDQPSKLYDDLLSMIGDRFIANYVYASYLQSGVAAQMTSDGFETNEQGQHNAQDVFNWFDVNSMLDEVKSSTSDEKMATAAGFRRAGKAVMFDSSEEATIKAQKFNEQHKGKMAYVVQVGDKFSVIVKNLDSRTLEKKVELDRQMTIWQEVKTQFNKIGINVEELEKILPDLFNTVSITRGLQYMKNIFNAPNETLRVNEIKMLLAATPDSIKTKNAISRYGSIDQAAVEIYNSMQDPNAAGREFAQSLLDYSKNFVSGSAISVMYALNNTVLPNFELSSSDSEVKKIIDDLNQKFGTESQIIVRSKRSIKTFSDAAVEQIVTLERQIRILRDKKVTDKAQLDQLQKTQQELLDSLNNERYYSGTMQFLSQAIDYVEKVGKLIDGLSDYDGTREEYITKACDLLQKMESVRDAYYDIVFSLSSLDALTIDENLSVQERNNIKELARKVKDIFDEQKQPLDELKENVMTEILMGLNNDNPSAADAISSIVEMTQADSSFMDNFYSFSRVSNPLIAAMGTIIRDAQDKRDMRMAEYTHRINAATKKLYKAGFTSDFMFTPSGRMISNIDWHRYYNERNNYIRLLKSLGHYGYELQALLEKWDYDNTEEEVVDKVSGRIQRVPIYKLADKDNPMLNLSDAQMEYYEEMKQIYAELQGIIPERFQDVYRPPQVRKSRTQVIIDTMKGKHTLKEGIKKLIQYSKKWKKQQDDTQYGQVELDGELLNVTKGDFSNEAKKVIPLFYVAKIDQSDLERNFSMSMQRFASTALNYSCLNDVQDVVETMNDFIQEKEIGIQKGNASEADVIKRHNIVIAKKLFKFGNATNTSSIAQGFVDMQLYGIRDKDDSNWARVLQSLIGFTSWKALTVNVLGGVSNLLVGEYQMLIECGAGEYYTLKDYAAAKALIFGKGMAGDAMDLITMNVASKGGLIAEMFDPVNESYQEQTRKRYYRSPFRQIFGSFNSQFIYSSGEKLIHYTNMYAVLQHEKVILDGKQVSLYSVLETQKDDNGIMSLKVKDGAVTLEGKAIDEEYLMGIRRRIREVNQQTHGSMNSEDKGIIHQRVIGRMVMNFRQWMVEHYSRRFRGILDGGSIRVIVGGKKVSLHTALERIDTEKVYNLDGELLTKSSIEKMIEEQRQKRMHFEGSGRDVSLTQFYHDTKVKMNGKKVSLYDAFNKVDTGMDDGTFELVLKDNVYDLNGNELTQERIDQMLNDYKKQQGEKEGYYTTLFFFMRDFFKEYKGLRNKTVGNWNNLTAVQKSNMKKAFSEIVLFCALLCLREALGDHKDHKNDFWRRFWIYQTKRLITEAKASMPTPMMVNNFVTILNSPIPSARTFTQLMYPLIGIGDMNETVKSGRHKGENKYIRNCMRYTIPFYNQLEQLYYMGEDDAVFYPFDASIGYK